VALLVAITKLAQEVGARRFIDALHHDPHIADHLALISDL